MPIWVEKMIVLSVFLLMGLIGYIIFVPEMSQEMVGLTSAQAITLLVVAYVLILIIVSKIIPSYVERDMTEGMVEGSEISTGFLGDEGKSPGDEDLVHEAAVSYIDDVDPYR